MILFIQQKRATFVFIGLMSLMLVLMSHDVPNHGGVDIAAELLFKASTPAVLAGSSVTTFFGDLFQGYMDLRGARVEAERYKERLAKTERERDRFRYLAASGERLERQLGLRESLLVEGVPARVAASNINSKECVLLLDRGKTAGVAAGMPVIAVGGVVGKVIEVSSNMARVQCIMDLSSGVGVLLQNSDEQGILVGMGEDSCEIHYLRSSAEVAHGDIVVTSGMDQIYPRGITVGRVVGIPQGEGVSRSFEIRPLVDFLRLLEVLVLKVKPPELTLGAFKANVVPASGPLRSHSQAGQEKPPQ